MNKNIFKFLLPLVAIVVIFEAVTIVNGIISKQRNPDLSGEPDGIVLEEDQLTPNEPAVFDINLNSDKEELKVGEKTKVTVMLAAKGNYGMDALSFFVKYDPKKMEITNLKTDNSLPKATYEKISTEKGLVVASFMITEADGYVMTAGQEIKALTFDVKPSVKGEMSLEISSGKEMKESATMFVETGSSKVLPYTSNKLTISAL